MGVQAGATTGHPPTAVSEGLAAAPDSLDGSFSSSARIGTSRGPSPRSLECHTFCLLVTHRMALRVGYPTSTTCCQRSSPPMATTHVLTTQPGPSVMLGWRAKGPMGGGGGQAAVLPEGALEPPPHLPAGPRARSRPPALVADGKHCPLPLPTPLGCSPALQVAGAGRVGAEPGNPLDQWR